jgi:hypothetical protein
MIVLRWERTKQASKGACERVHTRNPNAVRCRDKLSSLSCDRGSFGCGPMFVLPLLFFGVVFWLRARLRPAFTFFWCGFLVAGPCSSSLYFFLEWFFGCGPVFVLPLLFLVWFLVAGPCSSCLSFFLVWFFGCGPVFVLPHTIGSRHTSG